MQYEFEVTLQEMGFKLNELLNRDDVGESVINCHH